MTIALLVPVKHLDEAKTRLAPLLAAAERRALAAVMLEGTLAVAGRLAGVARRVVVTNYAPAIALARAEGFEVLREERQRSESDSVDAACALLAGEGVKAILRLPLDLPLLKGEDLAAILDAAAAGAPVVLVPSLSGTGTNALYRSPPALFASRFGPGSLALHEEQARRHGAVPRVLALESLALDIDDEDDVRELARRAVPCPALDYLRSIGIGARLAARQRGE